MNRQRALIYTRHDEIER